MSARLLGLVVLFTIIGPATQALAGVVHAPVASLGEPRLEVTGSVPDLVPGHPVTVRVRIGNSPESPVAVRVMHLTATVSDASTSCTAGNVRVSSYRWKAAGQTYSASPGTRVVVPLTMTLIETGKNQDACQGVRFPIRFSVATVSI